MDGIERQQELHRRARRGDKEAMSALYRSLLPLIKSRVGRLIGRQRDLFGGWYELEDLTQDAYLVFHRFVMSTDPRVPLYRVVAGAFERTLRTHLRRHAPLDERESPWGEEVDGPDGGRPTLARDPTGYDRACAMELLAALPSEADRRIVLLTAAGYTSRELANRLGISLAALHYRRRRIRSLLKRRGWGPSPHRDG